MRWFPWRRWRWRRDTRQRHRPPAASCFVTPIPLRRLGAPRDRFGGAQHPDRAPHPSRAQRRPPCRDAQPGVQIRAVCRGAHRRQPSLPCSAPLFTPATATSRSPNACGRGQVLVVHLRRAGGLLPRAMTCNPYARLSVGGLMPPFESEVQEQEINPRWNERFVLLLESREDVLQVIPSNAVFL